MPHGLSSPSTGTVKSVRMVGLSSTSTNFQFGSFSAQPGENSSACRFIERKILAVDPDQVDRAAIVPAGRLFGHHLGDGVCGVVELHMDEFHAVALFQLAAGPFEIGVDVFGAAPGVEIDGFAPGLLKHLVPLRRVGIGRPAHEAWMPAAPAAPSKNFRNEASHPAFDFRARLSMAAECRSMHASARQSHFGVSLHGGAFS